MNTTITTKQQSILLSKKGIKELKRSIITLEHDRSTLIRGLHELDRSSSHDDRLERIERLARLEAVEAELYEKRRMLSHAQLIPTRRARMKVALGSVVDLIDQQGHLFRYTLVDTVEANPSDGRISIISPLGSSLVGKTAHDTIQWRGGQSFQLISIK